MATPSFGPTALATPANALTLLRVVVTPLLVVLILGEGTAWLALGLWVVLAATDGVDGWLARRHGTTRSGAFLDPLADKVLVLGAMAALVRRDRLWWVPVLVIGVRELVLSLYRSYLARRGVSVPARPLAKVKTWSHIIVVAMAIAPVNDASYVGAVGVLLWVAVGLTVVTGAQYLLDGSNRAAAHA